jgi:hypothetical protein
MFNSYIFHGLSWGTAEDGTECVKLSVRLQEQMRIIFVSSLLWEKEILLSKFA